MLFELSFDNNLKNKDFQLYVNNSIFFQLRNLSSDQNLSFFILFVFLALLKKLFWIKKVSNDFKIYWKTLLKFCVWMAISVCRPGYKE